MKQIARRYHHIPYRARHVVVIGIATRKSISYSNILYTCIFIYLSILSAVGTNICSCFSINSTWINTVDAKHIFSRCKCCAAVFGTLLYKAYNRTICSLYTHGRNKYSVQLSVCLFVYSINVYISFRPNITGKDCCAGCIRLAPTI